MKELLAQRKEKKGKKPTFLQQDGHKKARLSKTWRKPRGRHSKIRLQLRGYKRMPKVGWGSPTAVKGLHQTGLEGVLVYNIGDVNEIDAQKQGMIIGRQVGAKKKLVIIQAAQAKNITLLEIKSIDDYKKELEKQFSERVTKKKGKEEKAAAKKEEKKKVEDKEEKKKEEKAEDKEEKEKKEKAEKAEDKEEKEKKEKAEKDKLLIKRQ